MTNLEKNGYSSAINNGEELNNRIHPLAFITIAIASIGILALGVGVLDYISGGDLLPPCTNESSPSCATLAYIFLGLPLTCSLIAMVIGAISRNRSNKMESKRSEHWSDVGCLLALICFISLPALLIFIFLLSF